MPGAGSATRRSVSYSCVGRIIESLKQIQVVWEERTLMIRCDRRRQKVDTA